MGDDGLVAGEQVTATDLNSPVVAAHGRLATLGLVIALWSAAVGAVA